MKNLIALFAVALFFLTGCPKKKDVPDAAVAVIVDAAPAPVATVEEDAAPPPTTNVDWLPSHVDDDTKAKKEITKANYKKELDDLDKEISAEK